MLRNDPYRDAFKAAAEATRARIRHDRARAPRVLKKVFTVVANSLFRPSLNAARTWKDAGVKDRALGMIFKGYTGVSFRQYIEARRIEVAYVLMLITDLKLHTISKRIGYTHYRTFTNAYKRQKHKLPSEVVREDLPPALIDDTTSLKAGRGLLDEDAVKRHVEDLLEIYPAAARRIQTGNLANALVRADQSESACSDHRRRQQQLTEIDTQGEHRFTGDVDTVATIALGAASCAQDLEQDLPDVQSRTSRMDSTAWRS